jgi:serine/threonine-protein kinase
LAFVKRAFAAATSDQVDIQKKTDEWVARALAEAEDLPEAQLAAGVRAAQLGDYVKAARHLRSAVAIAPTYAEAQEYLGHLQCEAGLATEGVRRLTQALALDPLLRVAPADLARHHLLHGRLEQFRKYRDELQRRSSGRGAVVAQLDLRAAAWRGDWAELQRLRQGMRELSVFSARFLLTYADYLLKPEVGEEDAITLTAERADLLAPRLATFAHQVMAEAFGLRGEVLRCREQVELATASALVDLEWLEYCPALASIRELPEFSEILYRVRMRTQAIWSV